MTVVTESRWVRGSFTLPDCSDDDQGLDVAVRDAIARLATVGVQVEGVGAETVDRDAELARLLASVFRPGATRGAVEHYREQGDGELRIVFDGDCAGGDREVAAATLSQLAEMGANGQVECIEIGEGGPAFSRWSVEEGLVGFDDRGRVSYT